MRGERVTFEQRLKIVLAPYVENGVLPLGDAQFIAAVAGDARIVWPLMEIESAERLIGSVDLGKLLDASPTKPLYKWLGFGRRGTSGDEAEKTLDTVGGVGLGLGDAEEATPAAGHVGLGG